jgi:hypothetical protein
MPDMIASINRARDLADIVDAYGVAEGPFRAHNQAVNSEVDWLVGSRAEGVSLPIRTACGADDLTNVVDLPEDRPLRARIGESESEVAEVIPGRVNRAIGG